MTHIIPWNIHLVVMDSHTIKNSVSQQMSPKYTYQYSIKSIMVAPRNLQGIGAFFDHRVNTMGTAAILLSLMEGKLLYLRIFSGECASWHNKHAKHVAVARDAFLVLCLTHSNKSCARQPNVWLSGLSVPPKKFGGTITQPPWATTIWRRALIPYYRFFGLHRTLKKASKTL